jgi:hypothetical protein
VIEQRGNAKGSLSALITPRETFYWPKNMEAARAVGLDESKQTQGNSN